METAVEIATLVAVLISAAGLMFAVTSFRRTMYSNILINYSQKFEKIMEELPREIFLPPSEPPRPLPPRSDDLTLTCIKYFNLTLEELWLRKNGYFPRDLWDFWEKDIKNLLASPLMVREWRSIRENFGGYQEFYNFVEEAQEQAQLRTTKSVVPDEPQADPQQG